MSNVYISNIFRFFLLIFLQVLVLNNILFSGFINPYLYVLFILLLPIETPKLLLLALAFLLGISIDVLTHTYGMHAAACVLMAYARPFVIKRIYSRHEFEPGIKPIIRDLGFSWVLSYTVILVFIHHLLLFYIEAFSFKSFWITLFRTVISATFTVITIIFSHYIIYRTKK